MLIEQIMVSFIVLLALALLAKFLSRFIILPFASVLVAIGYLSSELLVALGVDTGLRAENFQSLIFYIFIPVLVFYSALSLDKLLLKKHLLSILFLAIVVMLFSCVVSAVLLYAGIAHETGFPLMAALITGAILAATDPEAIIDSLQKLNVPKQTIVMLQGESLFNDAAAIVLFTLFITLAQSSAEQSNTLLVSSGLFLQVFLGGVVCGCAVGLVSGFLAKKLDTTQLVLLSLVSAYGAYLLAELFAVSGVMATLLAALIMSTRVDALPPVSKNAWKEVWQVFSYIVSAMVFLLVGAVMTLEMFQERWLAILIAWVAIVLARAFSIYGGLSFIRLLRKQPVALLQQTVLVWGGLRGAVTLALALSLPTTLDYWWTIQSIAFGVVLLTLFVQAPTMSLLAKYLGKKS